MSFESLEDKDKKILIKLISRERVERIEEKFSNSPDLIQQAFHVLAYMSLDGTVTLNDKDIFTDAGKLNAGNFLSKEGKAIELFTTTITPQVGAGIEFKNFDNDTFEDLYRKLKPRITNQTFVAGMDTLYNALNPTTQQTPSQGMGIISLRQFVKKFEIGSPEGRNEIYNWWEDTHLNVYAALEDSMNNADLTPFIVSDSITKIVESITSGKKKIRVPAYTVWFTSKGRKNQAIDDIAALELANIFFTKRGILEDDLEEYTKIFGRKKELRGTERQYDAEGRKLDAPQVEIDDPSDNTVEDLDIPEEMKFIEKNIDPLTAIAIYSKGKKGEYDLLMDKSGAEKIKAIILRELNKDKYQANKIFENLLQDLDLYLEDIKENIVERDNYVISILDDTDHVNIIDRIYGGVGGFVYTYYEITITDELVSSLQVVDGELKNVQGLSIKLTVSREDEIIASSYEKFVDRINSDAKEFFKFLSTLLDLEKETKYVYNEWKDGLGSTETGGYLAGGDLPALSGKEAKFNETNEDLFEVFEDYFFDRMNPIYFFGKDAPEFTKSAEYKSLKSIFDKRKKKPVSRIKRDLGAYGQINVKKEDIINLKEFFKLLRRYTTLGITPKVKEAFDEAFISLVNIHLVADEIEGRAQMKEISTTYRNMLGKILYEIAEYNNLDETQIDDIEWQRRSLSTYASAPYREIDNINEILDDEDFMAYAKKEKFHGDLRRLKAEIENNKTLRDIAEDGDIDGEDIENMMYKSVHYAYIVALDNLRKIEGKRIYKGFLHLDDIDDIDYVSDLIKKENNVDVFVRDIEGIVESDSSFNTLSKTYGVSEEVIYKIRGLFR